MTIYVEVSTAIQSLWSHVKLLPSIYLLWHATPALLDDGLGHGPREDHDGIELGVIQFVHR